MLRIRLFRTSIALKGTASSQSRGVLPAVAIRSQAGKIRTSLRTDFQGKPRTGSGTNRAANDKEAVRSKEMRFRT